MSTRAWSDEYDEQYSHRPGAYPTLNRFYRDLFAGGLEFQLIKTFKVYPSLLSYRWNDDRAELTFRLLGPDPRRRSSSFPRVIRSIVAASASPPGESAGSAATPEGGWKSA